ncbi:DeoR/GlpR family DNA-binding transcription regulator [Cloacibacillus sp. An23]|uniref:DeoR/GlpR family DNA-binding transcription regulator n=1 Tax=Cloacibacillus sp. An23 TaxID=1965591 RepID=UPI00130253D4|nr:DeoR/GlpR family DNA-binding transcription regulator [Cloacibacillus sp. An23]
MENIKNRERRIAQELELLKKRQYVSVKELAEMLNVSVMTIRRDLELLRKNHVLERSHGYATLVKSGYGYANDGEVYDLRMARIQNINEKDRVAKYAATLVSPGDWIFLDNGTTVARIVHYLPTDFEFTAVCYNFAILLELLKHPNIKIIFPGGYYHPEDYNFTSSEAVDFIRRHRANKSFLSVSGIHESLGITCINSLLVEHKRAMIASSAVNIIMADSSKFGVVKANHFADISDIDMIITDNKLSPEWQECLSKANIKFKLV